MVESFSYHFLNGISPANTYQVKYALLFSGTFSYNMSCNCHITSFPTFVVKTILLWSFLLIFFWCKCCCKILLGWNFCDRPTTVPHMFLVFSISERNMVAYKSLDQVRSYISDTLLCYVMLCYVMLCYVMLCYVMLCYAMLCYVMLCYVMLCYVMLCYVMLCYVMLCYVMLCYVMLCYVMLCYVMLCYVMLCYVMLCYVIIHNIT